GAAGVRGAEGEAGRAVYALGAGGGDELLLVSGQAERPVGVDAEASPAVSAIRALAAAHPDLRVYAALDPYRSGFAAELAYAEAKLEAGAMGLFTQPFFDVRLLAVWQELTAGI